MLLILHELKRQIGQRDRSLGTFKCFLYIEAGSVIVPLAGDSQAAPVDDQPKLAHRITHPIDWLTSINLLCGSPH